MGMFGRIVDVVNANVNDLLDKAEDPEKMIKQIIREIEENIDKAKKETAKILAESKRLEKEVEAKAKDVDTWQKRAEIAVDSNDDELARKAIERKRIHENELENLTRQLDDTLTAVDQMKESMRLLQQKLSEARARQTSLVARSSAAKTAKEVQKQVNNLADPSKALGKLEKFERRVEDMEAEARAMSDANVARDEIEKEFEEKEDKLAVDAELAALKAKRGK